MDKREGGGEVSQRNASAPSCGTGVGGIEKERVLDVGWQKLGGYLPAEMAT
jgi:hypothetical protein